MKKLYSKQIDNRQLSIKNKSTIHQFFNSLTCRPAGRFAHSLIRPFTHSLIIFLFCTSALAQNLGWAKVMGGTVTDVGSSIATDASGNVYTIGSFSGTADFDPGAGVFNLTSAALPDIFISKVDASGNFVWAKAMGGTDHDEGLSISTDASGNVYTTGWFVGTADFDPGSGVFNLTSAGWSDIFISKLDASGNFVWAKRMGSTSDDRGHSIATDASGNVYTIGLFNGTADFDPSAGTFNLISAGSLDVFISKLDTSGNFVWAKKMGGINVDAGNSIAIDPSGNVFTTGYFEGTADFDPGAGVFNLTPAGNQDIFISKLDASGNFVWTKKMGGTNQDHCRSIATDASGNVYTTGWFNGTADFDPGAGVFTLVGSGAIFISKLDASGNFVWAKQMGGTGSDEGRSIALDASGNVYTTGYFNGTVDFDPGAGVSNLTSAGVSDIFISKLDASGNFVWAKRIGETDYDSGNSIATDASGNVFTTGFFSGTADFDPGAGVFNLTSAGEYDIFIAKYAPCNITAMLTPQSATTFCTGDFVVLNANTGSGYTYQWLLNVNQINGATNSNYTASQSGNYSVLIDSLGCSGTSSATLVTVNPLPTVGSTANPSATVCTGTSVTLNGTGASTYTWTGGITNGTAFTPTSTLTYTVTGTDINTCTNTATKTITVNQLPTVTASATASTFCIGGSTTLTGGGASTYTWTGGVTNGTAFSPTSTLTFTVTGTDANTCANTATQTITVNPLPTVSINNIPNFININASPIALTGNPTGGTFIGIGVSSNNFSPIIAGLGKKHITYNYTDNNTCSNSSVLSTIVYDTTGIICTTHDTTYISVTDTLVINTVLTGINPPNNFNTIKVFPNPAHDHITINYGNFASMSGYTLKITNNLGQVVFTTPINQQSSYIDLSTWTGNGLYFVATIDGQGNTVDIKKIVIQ